MLEFIYCGQVVLTEALALDLLAASNKYALPELKARCEEFLVQNLSLETIVKRVELAEQLDAMVLRDGATTYLVKNAKNVTGKIELDELPKGFLIDLLSKTIFKYEFFFSFLFFFLLLAASRHLYLDFSTTNFNQH